MSAPEPWSEPARFYRYAARRQARGLATLPPPHRIPEERHVEMLRLRLVEGLTLDEVGARLKCDLCGNRPERYYPARQEDAPGFARSF